MELRYPETRRDLDRDKATRTSQTTFYRTELMRWGERKLVLVAREVSLTACWTCMREILGTAVP